MLLFAATWLWHLASTSLSPPVDDLEQLTWVKSLQWGYYKHPPLPTWLLWLAVRWFGWSDWTVYAMGAAVTLAALAIYWRLLISLRGRAYALVALLGAACITYYNGRLNYYNHNILLLLASTSCAALCWLAFTRRQFRWWAALGLAVGLGGLAKYQVVVAVACVLAFALHERAWTDPMHQCGLAMAGGIALLVMSPHLWWLIRHGFQPVGYAVHSSLGASLALPSRMLHSAHWLVDQVLNRALPALMLVGWICRSSGKARDSLASGPFDGTSPRDHDGPRSRALLAIWGLVPLVFMPAVGLLTGADLQLHWGTPFLLFVVPAVMDQLRSAAWRRLSASQILVPFVAIQALLLLVSFLTSPLGPPGFRRDHWRNVNSRHLAEALAAPARLRLEGPIRIISGPPSIAGALALQLPEHPLVLIDGKPEISPWVTPAVLQGGGVVEVGQTPGLPGGTEFGPDLPGWSWRIASTERGPR